MLRQSLPIAAALFALGLMAACSSSTSESVDTADTAGADAAVESEPAQPTVFDEQLKALEKAKEVEETLKKAQADRDKAMEEEETGG